jgi:hypothetical protein
LFRLFMLSKLILLDMPTCDEEMLIRMPLL